MNSDIYEVICCPEDDEYRVSSDICDKFCVERFYKINLKSSTHTDLKEKTTISTSQKNESKSHKYPPKGRGSSRMLF